MNELIEKEIFNIEDMIYEIDGKEVMLDSDLAKLYHVETKRINEAVKNNPEKFPIRYSWKLSIDETMKISRSKFSTLKTKQGFNIKYGARIFTEQGIYMLATILKSKEFVHQGAQLSWKHNVSLIEKVKDKSIRKRYIEKNILL